MEQFNYNNEQPQLDSHDKGVFANIYEVHKKYPGGGADGDYVTIQGFAHYWNADRGTWVISEGRDEYWNELLQGISEEVGKIAEVKNSMQQLMNGGYLYAGTVGPLSPAPEPTLEGLHVMVIAIAPGVYTNFGDIQVKPNHLTIIRWNGEEWTADAICYFDTAVYEEPFDETEYIDL